MPDTTEDKVNALACAVAVLEGTDGGYSPKEKAAAKMVLMRLKADMVRDWQDKQGSPHTTV